MSTESEIRRREARTLRLNRETYRRMTLVNLLNHAHASLTSARMVFSDDPANRRLARTHAAGIAAIANELDARGDDYAAAGIRSYRRTAMTAPLVQWGQDAAGRIYPLALPAAYDIYSGRMRRRNAPKRTR